MKKILTIFGAVLLASVMITSCGGDASDKKEETKTRDTLEESIDTLIMTDNINVDSAKSKKSNTSNKATCMEKETPNEDPSNPGITKTCLYKKYKTISKGYPDYKGRYSYVYSLFKKQENGSYVQIKNATLFNENKKQLLSIINSKIKKDYYSYANYSETKDCFEGAKFTPFNFDQLGINFDADNINFNVTFGLSGACMSVDGTIISFNLDEIQKYLNE